MKKSIGERIKGARKAAGMSQNELATKANISQPTLSTIERGAVVPTADSIMRIAEALGEAPSDLLGEKYCPVCGFEYTYKEGLDCRAHKMMHAKAVHISTKYGFYWPYRQRLIEMDNAYKTMQSQSATTDEKKEAAILLFKALFCRSAIAYQHDDHPSFYSYVRMLLSHGSSYFEEIPPDVFSILVEQYGQEDGMPTGSYYSRLNDDLYETDDPRLNTIFKKIQEIPPKYLDVIEMLCDKLHE